MFRRTEVSGRSGAPLVFQVLPERLCAHSPLPLAFDQRALVLLALDMGAFCIELAEALQAALGKLAGRDRRGYGATGLVAVAAVAEPAHTREVRDICERLCQAAAVP